MDGGQALALRLSQREPGALEDAYATYAAAVHAFASRFVGPTDADDVVQRTFLDLWRSARSIDHRQRLTGWLFTVARRRAIDVLRSRREVVDVEEVRHLVGEDGRETAARFADAADVRAAVASLPEHERLVIELTYFADLTQAQVAERLGAPIGTVKARASRGTRRLAELMSATSEAEGSRS